MDYETAEEIMEKKLKELGINLNKEKVIEGTDIRFYFHSISYGYSKDYSSVMINLNGFRIQRRFNRFDVKEGDYALLKKTILKLSDISKKAWEEEKKITNEKNKTLISELNSLGIKPKSFLNSAVVEISMTSSFKVEDNGDGRYLISHYDLPEFRGLKIPKEKLKEFYDKLNEMDLFLNKLYQLDK